MALKSICLRFTTEFKDVNGNSPGKIYVYNWQIIDSNVIGNSDCI